MCLSSHSTSSISPVLPLQRNMSGGSRVLIPNNVRKTIQDIKEITGKHSDEDIHAMLKECNMDPNETAQKLLYIDTFHEVKRKRDRRKVNVSNRASEEYRTTLGTQWRGARGNRRNYNLSDDVGGGRNMCVQMENGVNNRLERGLRHSIPVIQKTENNATAPLADSTVFINDLPGVSSGSSSDGSVPQLSEVNTGNLLKDTTVDVSKLGTVPILPTVAVRQPSMSNPGPTPAPTPTTVSASGARVQAEGALSMSSSNDLLLSTNSASASGVFSAVSDPMLVPSLNSQAPCAVGTIKLEVGSQCVVSKSNPTLLSTSKSSTGQDVAIHDQMASGNQNSTNRARTREYQEVEKSQLPEVLQSSALPTHDGSLVVISNQDSRLPQQLSGPSRVITSEPAVVPVAKSLLLPEFNDPVLEEATPKLDMKLDKLNISDHQPVIFPDHLHVPEAFKNGLTFGSLDTLGCKDSEPVAESIQVNSETAREPSISNPNMPSSTEDGNYPHHPHSPPHVPKNVSSLEDNASSGAVLKYEQSKQEVMPPLGPQYRLIQTTPDYSFGFVPPVATPHLVQFEGPEIQSGNSVVSSTSDSTPPATQPAGVAQSSMALPPQLFPLFRQPYPHNFIPYGPYFPHIYLPHNAHQFIGHTGFPQHPLTGNIYVQPAAASSGAKFPVPPLYKAGTNAGNPTHFGIPSGYGSFGSTVAYSNTSVTPRSSTGNEDVVASEVKENTMYSAVQQGEDSHVWTPAPGQDMSGLPANYFYDIPQGQQVAFSPAQAGHSAFANIYHHQAQSMAVASAAQPLLQHSQAMAGSVESTVQLTGAFEQSQHAQINWNPKLLNRESI